MVALIIYLLFSSLFIYSYWEAQNHYLGKAALISMSLLLGWFMTPCIIGEFIGKKFY